MEINFKFTINDKLVAFFKKVFTVKTAVFFVSVCFFAAGLFLFSAPIDDWYTFHSGEVISSSKVNRNFDDIITLLNQHDNSISSLQAGGDGYWNGDSSNISYMGNVGIGTASPGASYKLDIQHASGSDEFIRLYQAGTGNGGGAIIAF
jgi:hypothetical protein